MRIYITHCSLRKDDLLRGTGKEVPPDKLYTSPRIQKFMKGCKARSVNWAIFSDLYGVWFPQAEHEWYNKGPDEVTEEEFRKLVSDFDHGLREFDDIWFYYNPSRFHSLYRRLLTESRLKGRVRLFTHISQISEI